MRIGINLARARVEVEDKIGLEWKIRWPHGGSRPDDRPPPKRGYRAESLTEQKDVACLTSLASRVTGTPSL